MPRTKRILIAAVVLLVCASITLLFVGRGQSSVALALSLQTPEQSAEPVIPVTVSTSLPGARVFQIDIDLNHDSRFEGADELGYASGDFGEEGAGVVRLHGLVRGVYQVRARFTPPTGKEIVSPVRTMEVLPPPGHRVPAVFEPNKGQTDDKVLFLGRVQNQMVYITAEETVLTTAQPRSKPKLPEKMGDKTWEEAYKPWPVSVQRFRLVGANAHARPTGAKKLPGISNYFIGNDPSKWRTDIENYQEVVTRGVYPGIDLVYYSSQGRLEYDFVVAPNADPSVIALEFADVTHLSIDADGALVLHLPRAGDDNTGVTTLRKTAPVMYQRRGEQLEAVKGDWVLKGTKRAGYIIGAYDRQRELVIDPILFSTFLGGAGFDDIFAAKNDALGNVYVAGSTTSNNFPTTAGAYDLTLGGGQDVFITKINQAGTALLYSTYLGGSASDGPTFGGLGIDVNAANEVVVTSETSSNDFPTVVPFQAAIVFFNDAFVTKLNAAGNGLIFSTYLGGNGFDFGNAAAYDGAGNVFVCGNMTSAAFPVSAGAFQTVYGGGGLKGDAYVIKFSPVGARIYCTLLGGAQDEEGQAIAVLGTDAFVSGITASANFPTTPGAFQTVAGGMQDIWVTRVNATGTALVYSTYLGGSGNDGKNGLSFGAPLGLTVDAAGNAYMASGSDSPNYPTTPGAFQTVLGGASDGVITKVNPTGSGLVWSTYLGGTGTDILYAIVMDAGGNLCVTGDTGSANIPLVNQVQAYMAPFNNAYIAQMNPTGNGLVLSSPIGGFASGRGIALDGIGNIWIGGTTVGMNFPVVNPLFPPMGGFHSWVTKIGAAAGPPPPPPPGTGPVVGTNEGNYFEIGGPVGGSEGSYGFGNSRSSVRPIQTPPPPPPPPFPILYGPDREATVPNGYHVFNISQRQQLQAGGPTDSGMSPMMCALLALSGLSLAALLALAYRWM